MMEFFIIIPLFTLFTLEIMFTARMVDYWLDERRMDQVFSWGMLCAFFSLLGLFLIVATIMHIARM